MRFKDIIVLITFGGVAVGRWSNRYVIGLTGNIATGKSVVRKMLQHAGAYTIDADQLAHQAMMPGAPAYKPIIQAFGQFIVGPDKQINRQMLGQMVFGNPAALKKLEEITHPIIRQAIDVLVKRSKKRVVVIEAIKLLDGELKNYVDAVWVVNASRGTQYKRLVGKRGMSEDDAKQRILAQGAQADKVKQADVVIENDGDVEKTWKQVQLQWEEIKKQLASSAKPAASASAGSAPAEKVEAAPVEDEPEEVISLEGLNIRRGKPDSAAQIAEFINAHGAKDDVTRMDVMMSFGQKSFLLAQDEDDAVLALLGWTVENLVTRMDEFYVKPGVPVDGAVRALIVAVEEASMQLQSEAAFLFLPNNTAQKILDAFKSHEYAPITLKEIKIPIWREAVEESMRNAGDQIVLWKQLRQDRVLQPI
ncbi:MAG: dephospho-CoA kinase [Chloroflexota bacterium]